MERFGEKEEGIASWRKRFSESELSIWRKALKTIHFTRTTDLTPNMANSTLIKSIDIHYKTPRPLWVALPEPSNGAVCLQIPSGSVWKTKRGFTSTSLTSYNKQNNVFLMDGESRLPLPLPSSRSRATGQWWVSHDCSLWCHDDGWARLVGAASCPSPLGRPMDWQAHCGARPVLTYCSARWHSHREPQKMPAFPLSHAACFTSHTVTETGKMHAEAYASMCARGGSCTNSC